MQKNLLRKKDEETISENQSQKKINQKQPSLRKKILKKNSLII